MNQITSEKKNLYTHLHRKKNSYYNNVFWKSSSSSEYSRNILEQKSMVAFFHVNFIFVLLKIGCTPINVVFI